jgi:hypothetical protein
MQTWDHVKQRKIKFCSREEADWKMAWRWYFLSWKCATLDAELRDTSTVKYTRKKDSDMGPKNSVLASVNVILANIMLPSNTAN